MKRASEMGGFDISIRCDSTGAVSHPGFVQGLARGNEPAQLSPRHQGRVESMAVTEAQAKQQLVEWLSPECENLYSNAAGQVIAQFDASRLVVLDVTTLPSSLHRVYLSAPIAFGVPFSQNLAAHIGLSAGNFHFGSIGLRPEDETPNPLMTVEFEYSAYFEGMTATTFVEAVKLVADTRAAVAGEILSRFGGEAPF